MISSAIIFVSSACTAIEIDRPIDCSGFGRSAYISAAGAIRSPQVLSRGVTMDHRCAGFLDIHQGLRRRTIAFIELHQCATGAACDCFRGCWETALTRLDQGDIDPC
jgi:hypothetical protein